MSALSHLVYGQPKFYIETQILIILHIDLLGLVIQSGSPQEPLPDFHTARGECPQFSNKIVLPMPDVKPVKK